MTATAKSFRVADVEVALCAPAAAHLDALSGYYDLYPSAGGAPDLVLDFRHVHGFTAPPARSTYPGFDAEPTGHGCMRVWRNDAAGTIECPDDPARPVRASFEVASTAAVESAIRIAMSVTLPRLGGLILHASAVADGDRALIFSGVSGAGKSTIAELLQTAQPRLLKLSDDLLLVRPGESGRWRVHVAPFHGLQGLPHGHESSIDSLNFISHAAEPAPAAAEHRRERLSHSAALPLVLRHALAYVADATTAQRALDVAGRLTAEVPCFTLEFARDASVATVLGVPVAAP